jgi:hypothetical protein
MDQSISTNDSVPVRPSETAIFLMFLRVDGALCTILNNMVLVVAAIKFIVACFVDRSIV